MYKTLEELAVAYNTGVLDREKDIMTLDNDAVYVYTDSGEGEKVFEAHPEDLLPQALDMLEIPHDHV